MQALKFEEVNWQGHRMTGLNGAKTISSLTQLLDLTQLNAVNSILDSSYTYYSPWMSSYDQSCLSDLQALHGPKNIRNLSKDDLMQRSLLLSSGSGKNLKKIYPSCDGKMYVSTNTDDFNYFSQEINKFLQMISSLDDSWKLRVENLVHEVLLRKPVNDDYSPRRNGTGLTTHLYRKGIFLSLPVKSQEYELELMLNLVHEIGHLAMVTYQNYDSIIEKDISRPIFSVIRKTQRPAILSFHAMVATMYMLEFLVDLKRSGLEINTPISYINDRSKELIQSLQEALKSFKGMKFSKLGQEIYSEAMGLMALAQLKL